MECTLNLPSETYSNSPHLKKDLLAYWNKLSLAASSTNAAVARGLLLNSPRRIIKEKRGLPCNIRSHISSNQKMTFFKCGLLH